MKLPASIPTAAIVALCLCAAGCSSTVRRHDSSSATMRFSLLQSADFEVLGNVEGYGTRLFICGIPFGEGRYAYVNCPIDAALPPKARQRPDVFKQNPIVSDIAIVSGIIIGEFVLPFPMWVFLLEFEPSPARDAVATATFNALHKQPDADTFLPESVTIWNKGFWPLYCREYAEVQGKAIRVKSDKERFSR